MSGSTGGVRGQGGSALPVRQRAGIPEAVRAACGMPGPDYVDVFTLTVAGARDTPPERWARTAFEEVAGRGGQFIWRGLLGLRLQRRPSPGHVAGWRIGGLGEDWVRLEAQSWMLTGNLVLHLTDGEATLVTALRYDRPFARAVWPPLAAVHRRLAPGLLRDTYAAL